MATLREIQQRIKSIKSTQQITRAMKMVAAAKMRRAQERMFAARPYAEKIRELIENMAASVENPESPLLNVRPVNHLTLVVVTADRGLCGSFNSTVIRRAAQDVGESSGIEVSLICLGKKGADFFGKREYDVSIKDTTLFNELEYRRANTYAQMLMDRFVNGQTDAVKLIYNEFKSVASQVLQVTDLLPIDMSQFAAQKTNDYLYEPSQESLLEALLPRHISMQLWRTLLESYAAEQAARMVAMENATDNASELIHDLTLEYNKARQAAITTEILEIVSGANALKNA